MKHGLSAAELRCLAMALMLVDHLYHTCFPGCVWMNALGRLAFPIFAFQIAEGYFHTKDLRRYRLRLLIGAAISEIPFDRMAGGVWFYPDHQNVLFTLALGLTAVDFLEQLHRQNDPSPLLLAGIVGTVFAADLMHTDYGAIGVMTVLLFALLRDAPHEKALQVVGMILLHGIGLAGYPIRIPGLPFSIPIQLLAVLGLIPIWLYDGRKGFGGRIFRVFSYSFYPLHLLALVLIQRFCL